jgi:hypothetical protein
MATQKKIKYPVGVQTFSRIIGEGYLYVDKTALVYELANDYDYVFLSRPRRFGKSLLLSTLEEYFRGNRELFKGLAIEQLETEWTSYPVLRFDLSSANYDDIEVLRNKISAYLTRMETDLEIKPEKELGDRFMNVIIAAYKRSGQRVVVLIDEYDKPMLESLHDEALHTAMRNELRGFYSVLKECDSMIRFAMLTGVTKFGKVNIFSGLNNLIDISMMREFNEICGISEQEFHKIFPESVRNFADYNNLSEQEVWENFKSFYDGYHFSRSGADIYNPFSTLTAFKRRDLGSFWFTSGSSDYLIRLIERHPFSLDRLEGACRSEQELSDISDMSRDIVPLLYQAGYLTIRGYDAVSRLYTLGFPNREVSQGFWNSLAAHFFRPRNSAYCFSLEEFIKDIMRGHAESLMTRIMSLFASLESDHEVNKEVHFRNMLSILVSLLGFRTIAEMHSAQGRCDLVIESPQYIYVIELKIASSPEMAMAQIHDKGYNIPYGSDSRDKILIGANFSTKTRTLSGWLIERPS